MDAPEVATRLRGPLSAIAEARDPSRGLPDTGGLYAWWMHPNSLPGVTGPAHPTEPLQLLYIGLAPRRPSSHASLRSRVLGQHVGGNIGSSTFPLSLAALLISEQGWRLTPAGSRAQLDADDNRALSAWQRDHLRLSWVEHEAPWDVERSVIELMAPPLNLADNPGHPLRQRLSTLRKGLRAPPTSSGAAAEHFLPMVTLGIDSPPTPARPRRAA